jgi:hypothetical protein
MKFRKIKLLILVCLFANLAQAGLSDLLQTDPWKFIQEKFITTPNAKATKMVPMIAKLSTGFTLGSAAGLLSHFLSKLLHKKIEKKTFDLNTKSMFKILRYLIISASTALVGYLSYCAIHNLLVSNYQHQQLIDLMENWHELKSHVPSDLRPAFEKMHKKFKVNPKNLSDESEDIIRVITEQVDEKFRPKTTSKFWDSKILNGHIFFDIANTIGSVTRIFKN